jgi:hypothetical protein
MKELSKSEKAVAIARDVLQQFKDRSYTTGYNTWFKTDSDLSFIKKSKDFIGFVSKLPEVCEVCADGALLCSSLNLFNGATVNDSRDAEAVLDSKNIKHLYKYFSKETLILLEHTYEHESYGLVTQRILESLPRNHPVRKKIDIFREYAHSRYPGDDDRITYLMRNLVRNGGELVIPRAAYRHYKEEVG